MKPLAGIKTSIVLMSSIGYGFTTLFLVAFGAWAFLAPLAGAAVAPGIVTASGANMNVQHLEGGIVKTLRVHEGDRVHKGDALIVMDATAAQALRNRFQTQVIGMEARSARLVAERDGLEALVFPAVLSAEAEREGTTLLLEEQRKEFDARRKRHLQERVILGQQVRALADQMQGLVAQEGAIERQLAVVREEVERKRALLGQGLTNRSEYTLLLRSEAELVGQKGQIVSSILSAKTQSLEAEEQLSRLDTQRVETAVTQLNGVRVEQADAGEQLRQATDVLRRTVVTAPSDGVVVKMNVNSEGSVVRPGEPMLELLPTGDDLVVEARVSPRDIDVLSLGQSAKLRFSALNTRTTPQVDASVTYVSADRFVDPQTGQPYYIARLRIADELPPEIDRARIYPGMPVETYIATSDRTFSDYLLKPLSDSFSRAFREE